MEKLRPSKLKEGDEIRIIAPASAPNMKELSKGISKIKKFGYKVTLGRNIKRLVQIHQLAASGEERAEELMTAFKDDSVKAIFCARGGYGSIHTLPLIDYDVIRDHPKIFIGYSDITALHLAFNALANLVTFHGPMPASDPDEISKPSFKSFLDFLSGKSSDLQSGNIEKIVKYVNPGTTEGVSLGTNISVASSLFGTMYMPKSEGKLLFAEDTGITAGDIDRYFFTMKLGNYLSGFTGYAFGEFRSIVEEGEPMPYVEDVVETYMREEGKPSLYGLPFGHSGDQMLIPLNLKMRLSTQEEPYLEILENAVE